METYVSQIVTQKVMIVIAPKVTRVQSGNLGTGSGSAQETQENMQQPIHPAQATETKCGSVCVYFN